MKIVRRALLFLAILLAGCSSDEPQANQNKQSVPAPVGAATTTSKHPYAKYLEIVGFRFRERQPGKVEVKFVVVNHSEADLGDLTLKITLRVNGADPGDPPVTEFEAKVMGLGPMEMQEVTGVGDTKLRVYELPDWQFLRPEFDITYPPAQ